jgi:hypothetical protein
MRSDLRDVAAVRDRLRGTYGLPENPNGLLNRAYHVTRDLNYLRLLGGMTISSLPDLGTVVMRTGFLKLFGDGFVPMARNFSQFPPCRPGSEAGRQCARHGARQPRDGLGRRHGRLRPLVEIRARAVGALQQVRAGLASSRRGRRASSSLPASSPDPHARGNREDGRGRRDQGGGADPARRAWDRSRDGRAHRPHVPAPRLEEVRDLRWANTTAWDDEAEAAETYRAALSKEVDLAVVTPGQERPSLDDEGHGPGHRAVPFVLGRLDAADFALRAPAPRHGDAERLRADDRARRPRDVDQGERQEARGRRRTSAGWWVKEGLDRGGMFGWLFDVHNIVEKATRGAVGSRASPAAR